MSKDCLTDENYEWLYELSDEEWGEFWTEYFDNEEDMEDEDWEDFGEEYLGGMGELDWLAFEYYWIEYFHEFYDEIGMV